MRAIPIFPTRLPAPVLQRLRFSSIPVIFAKSPFRVQTFRDEQGDLYALVVNDNTDQQHGLQSVKVTLKPGGGTLLALRSTAESRPVAKLIEDFSVPAHQTQLVRAEVKITADKWKV